MTHRKYFYPDLRGQIWSLGDIWRIVISDLLVVNKGQSIDFKKKPQRFIHSLCEINTFEGQNVAISKSKELYIHFLESMLLRALLFPP